MNIFQLAVLSAWVVLPLLARVLERYAPEPERTVGDGWHEVDRRMMDIKWRGAG